MAKRISRKSKRRLMTFGTLSIVAIAYFLMTFVGYIYNFASLRKEERNLKQELTSLQEEKANLKIEIQKLNNPEYVARYAKEKYLYSKDGEYVLKINTKETTSEENKNSKDITVYVIGGGCIVFLCTILLLRKKNSARH